MGEYMLTDDDRIIAEKIKLLRKAHDMNQHALALEMYVDVKKIVQVENGRGKYTDIQVNFAKKQFGIVGMPLTSFECATYKERLYIFLELVKDERNNEARKMCQEMADIVNLEPCDDYLPMLFRVFEVKLLLLENDIATAEEKLDYLQGRLDKMNAEHLYYYYCNRGAISYQCGQYDEVEKIIAFYSKAFELAKDNKDFVPKDDNGYLHIAACCTYLYYPVRALLYLNKIREVYSSNNFRHELRMNSLFALNYIFINELGEAQKLLENCYVRAKSASDDVYTSYIEYCFGLLNMEAGRYEAAIKWFNLAMDFFEKGSGHYLRALYKTVRCQVEIKKFSKANELLEQTRPLYCNDKTFSPLFEALRHFAIVRSRLTLYNDHSIQYIEEKAIPHFEKTNEYYDAIDYYRLLESYYETKSMKKSMQMSHAIRRIYERCFLNKE